ncbi:unnamed protein product [Amoebophrya sp. A120]|nr:unnamed protein product [Amoebophrya sp. A120]|eukprot:GSA120T00016443001.1
MAAAVAAPLPPGSGTSTMPGTTAAGSSAASTSAEATATLTRKVRKVLQLRPDLLRDELKCLSKFVSDNNAHTRRNLRSHVEQQSLKVHEQFIQHFTPIESMLTDLDQQITELGDLADRVHFDLKDSRKKTKLIHEEALRLREKQQISNEKLKICNSFLKKFQLPEEDLERIRNSDYPIDNRFFQILEKIEEIRRNCTFSSSGGGAGGGGGAGDGSSIVGGGPAAGSTIASIHPGTTSSGVGTSRLNKNYSSNMSDASSVTNFTTVTNKNGFSALLNQTSAFDVIQETTEILDIAFERLFVSVQQQCRRLASSSGTTSSSSGTNSTSATFQSSDFLKLPSANLKKSLQYLKDRPVYFNHCLRDIAKMRKQLLNARFHEALSRGDGHSRPIEMCKTYDPVRYVGDILAWIHENVATEKEALTTFLGMSIKPRQKITQLHQNFLKDNNSATDVASTANNPDFDLHSRAEVLSSIVNYNEAVQNDDGLLADLNSILDFVLEGLLDSFKQRIESLLSNEYELPLLNYYKISRLMSYFKSQLCEPQQKKDRTYHATSNASSSRKEQFHLLHKDNRLVKLLSMFQQRMMGKFLEVCDRNSQLMREEFTTTSSSGNASALLPPSNPMIGGGSSSGLGGTTGTTGVAGNNIQGTSSTGPSTMPGGGSSSSSSSSRSRYAILDDLSAPLFVLDTVRLMEEIVADVESEEDFQPVVCAAYDPLLNYCRQMFSNDACDRAVFLINCLSLMTEPLKRTRFATERVEMYNHLLLEQIEYLDNFQAEEVLQKLNLLEKVEALRKVWGASTSTGPGTAAATTTSSSKDSSQTTGGSTPASSLTTPPPTLQQLQAIPELHPVGLSSVLRTFYTSLFTLKTLSLQHVEKISNRQIREQSRRNVCGKISDAYAFLYDGIQALNITTHTKEQVAMLLDPGINHATSTAVTAGAVVGGNI